MYLTAVKTALKDLFNWESSSLISVAGLAIAFTTVFFIYSRVTFELGYDSHHVNEAFVDFCGLKGWRR